MPDRTTIWKQPEHCLEAVQSCGTALYYVAPEIITLEMCRAAVKNIGKAILHVPDHLKTPEICLLAVRQDINALPYIPERLLTEELCLAAVREEGNALRYVPGLFRTAEICLAAVTRHGTALAYVPEALKSANLCLAAVRQHGMALQYVPWAARTEEICLAAVKRHGMALQYVPEAAQTDAVCTAAIRQHNPALQFVKRESLPPDRRVWRDDDEAEYARSGLVGQNSVEAYPDATASYDEAGQGQKSTAGKKLARDKAQFKWQVDDCMAFLESRLPVLPEIVIQLGTGLGELADALENAVTIPYAELPHFPRSTVKSHSGNLVVGTIAGKGVAILQGRFHHYEGYSARRVGFPIRVMARLGARTVLITNASGGLNPDFQPGELMLARDHINLLPDNPLRGPNMDNWGPRFPDCSAPYDAGLREGFLASAAALNLPLREGVYICVPGPSLETPAETRFFRQIGADAIGMSSVPEVLTALHAGMRVAMLSVIANVNNPDKFQAIRLEDIIAAAQAAEPRLRQLILHFLERP